MRLRQLEAELGPRVRWRMKSFLLVPEERTDRTFTEYHLAHRQAAAAKEGAPHFDVPPVGMHYPASSFPALEAAKWVEEHAPEQFDDYDLALFEAFFGRSEDISDIGMLVREAERVGVENKRLREALVSRAMRGKVIMEFHEAVDVHGVSAIPTVIIPNQPPIVSAVPLETYREAAASALAAHQQ